MNNQQHRIFRLTIDLSLPPDEEPSPIQDRISAILKRSLYQKINSVFAEYDDASLNVKLDRLNLDLGQIEINRLEMDFSNQVEEEFRTALLKLKENNPTKENSSEEVSALSSPLETLEFFLEKGSFPWWMTKDISKEPIQLFQQTFQREPAKLKSVISKIIGFEWPRKRIVNSFGEKEIKQIIKLLNPINSEIIIAYNEKLAKQHEKKPILKVGRKEFRKVGWEVILKYLFEERGSEFNQRIFLKKILKDVAARFNITYKSLLENLEAIATYFNASDQKEASLLKNISLLAQEEKSANKNITALGISSEAYQLSKGFSEQQLEKTLPFLQFVDGQKKHWIPNQQNIEASIILLKRLWEKDQTKALRMVKQIVLHDDNQLFLSRLNKDVLQSMFAILQPKLQVEFLNIKKDLITLAKKDLIASWSPEALEQMIYQHYFSFSIFSSDKWYDVKMILKPLLKKIADKSEWSYYKFIQQLLLSIPKTSTQIYLHSQLIDYLQDFLRRENVDIWKALVITNKHSMMKKENAISSDNWKFDSSKESVNEYLERLKSWLGQKEKYRTITSVFKEPNKSPQWIDPFVRNWSKTEKMNLAKLLWPALSGFMYDWLDDLYFLLAHFDEKELASIPQQIELELSIWKLLMGSASSGKSRVAIVNIHLNYLATELSISKSKLFNACYQLSESYATALKLSPILSATIKEAIHKNLFVTFNRETKFAATKGSNLANDMAAISQYFKTGLLPLGKTITSIRTIVLEQLKTDASRLEFWLKEMISEKERRERLCLFFSDSTTVDLMNVVHQNAGAYAFGILKIIAGLDGGSSKYYQGIREKEYWKLVWKILFENHSRSFNPRIFILKIIKKVTLEKGVEEVLFLEELQKENATLKGGFYQLIQSVLRVTYYLERSKSTNLSTPKKNKEYTNVDFSKMKVGGLINWIDHFLASVSAADTTRTFRTNKIMDFGKHISSLPETEKKNFWKLLSDAKTTQFFKQIVTSDEFSKIMDVAEVVAEVDRINKKEAKSRLFSFELSNLLLEAILSNRGSVSNQKSFIHKMLKDWANARNMVYKDLIEMLWPVVWQLAPIFHHHASLKIFSEVMKEELGPVYLEKKLLPTMDSNINQEDSQNQEEKPYRKLGASDEEHLELEEVWLIQNAGLSLLWPYFKMLFERAGLMADSEFLDEAAQQKGALLLEYLVSGNTAPEEYQLVFNKILCGIPVAAPIEVKLEIDESLKELCEGLLQAAITHWEILGETSIPSFRETFLMREGKLGITAKFWHLTVNSKAYDVLLRQLPWSIANISLSWVDLRLKVEWE